MSDFFNQSFWQGIVSSLVILLLSIWLSGSKKTAPTAGKGWKITVVLGNMMILGGLYLFAINFPNGHFNNMYANMGFCAFFIGFPIKYLGKFMV